MPLPPVRRIAVFTSLGLVLAGLALALRDTERPTQAADSGEQVVLLHGLGRSERSMAPLARRLEQSGFRVFNIDYASTERPIAELTEAVHQELLECCLDAERTLHFVTHSLGGILVRAYVAAHPPANLGRVVMLSPPNKGSELADVIKDSWLAEINWAPAVEELGTNPGSVPNLLGPPAFELGVITGDKSWHPFGEWLMQGDNDGVVSVESARLEGMKDFLILPATHTWIMRDPEVAEYVVRFLRTGAFEPASRAESSSDRGA